MTKIILDHPGTLPEHILQVLERSWGFGLPKDYREFLLKHNGGEPKPKYFILKVLMTVQTCAHFYVFILINMMIF